MEKIKSWIGLYLVISLLFPMMVIIISLVLLILDKYPDHWNILEFFRNYFITGTVILNIVAWRIHVLLLIITGGIVLLNDE